MKKYPALLNEKDISTDWLYDRLGDGNNLIENEGTVYKCAFYRKSRLWVATWETNWNTIGFRIACPTSNRAELDEFLNYVKKDICDVDEERLLVEFDTDRLYSAGEFSVRFYWADNENQKTMKEFFTYCKDYVLDNLDGYKGQKVYLCDLGSTLTMGPNMDGTLTFSRADALDYLKEWWVDAADYFDYERVEFGRNTNPFDNPEAYMVCMVIEGVNALISRAIEEVGLSYKWNDEVELTADVIDKLKESVRDMYVERLF